MDLGRRAGLAGIALLSLALFGCVPAYVEPVGDDAATVEFVNYGMGPQDLMIFRDPTDCRDRQVVKPGLASGERRDIRIATKGEIALWTVHTDFSGKICAANASFPAQPGRKYIFTLRETVLKDSGESACDLSVVEAAPSGGAPYTAVPIVERQSDAPILESDAFCKPEK